jgi:hypothetical protein
MHEKCSNIARTICLYVLEDKAASRTYFVEDHITNGNSPFNSLSLIWCTATLRFTVFSSTTSYQVGMAWCSSTERGHFDNVLGSFLNKC